MDSVLRALAIYLFLMIVLRIAGKRTLDQVTTFDFILLLIIGEATQQALLGDDFSVTNAFVVIVSLISLDIFEGVLGQRFKLVSKLVEGVPLVVVEDGKPLKDRMRKSKVDESEVLEAARRHHGLERMEQVKYAVLERSGGITIIPK